MDTNRHECCARLEVRDFLIDRDAMRDRLRLFFTRAIIACVFSKSPGSLF